MPTDTKRLNFLEKVCPSLGAEYRKTGTIYQVAYENDKYDWVKASGPSLRAAIDAAMAEERGE